MDLQAYRRRYVNDPTWYGLGVLLGGFGSVAEVDGTAPRALWALVAAAGGVVSGYGMLRHRCLAGHADCEPAGFSDRSA